MSYNPFRINCRELAPGTVSLTSDWAQGDDSKHDSDFSLLTSLFTIHPALGDTCALLINPLSTNHNKKCLFSRRIFKK